MTLPENGVYVVAVTRARLKAGETAGAYQLSVERGDLIIQGG